MPALQNYVNRQGDMSERRARAKELRLTPKDYTSIKKQEPSSKTSRFNGAPDHDPQAQQGQPGGNETHGQGIFDDASVAPEDFDQTLSSVDENGGYDAHHGSGIYGGAANGHPNTVDPRQHGQALRSGDVDFEDLGLSDDDQTVNYLQSLQKDPNFQSFQNQSKPRSNGPVHFVGSQSMYREQAGYSNQPIDKPRIAYNTPSSVQHALNRNYLDQHNRQSSPTPQDAPYIPNVFSTVTQEQESSDSEGSNSEGQGRTSPFGATEDQDALFGEEQLRGPTAGKQHVESDHQSSDAVGMDVELVQPDYNEDVLYKMDYATLKDQPFDAKPAEPPQPMAAPSSEASLEKGLTQVSKASREQQEEYFSHMSKDDWEKSGDWFIDQFTTLMKQMKEARQKKRDIAQEFEDEIAAREEAVRGKTVGIEKVLKDMKAGGEGVLKRKI